MEASASSSSSPAAPSRMSQARDALRRCDEHLVTAGKLAIESGQYREGTQELVRAARELATGVSYVRSGGATSLPSYGTGSRGFYDVAREAAFIELAADERRRGEAARREFANDPIRWSKVHGRYARTLVTMLPSEESEPDFSVSSARAMPAAGESSDEAMFSQMWIAVDALSRQFKESILDRKKGAPGPEMSRVSVDWLSRPPQ
jgi:hypothetical protein